MFDDFKHLFPNVKNNIYLKWDNFSREIQSVFESVKDPAYR